VPDNTQPSGSSFRPPQASRRVLERIKETGDVFMAWSDEPWVLEGAAVQVSIIGFDDGTQTTRTLDGVEVTEIHADLTSGIDLTLARSLRKSMRLAYYGDVKAGPFDVSDAEAGHLLSQPNPDGRSNTDVVRPWINASDVTGRPRNKWIIDFGIDMAVEEAARYEAPFEYVKAHVKPMRDLTRRKRYRDLWWLHAEPVPGMRQAIANLDRFIVTPEISKHRLFAWVDGATIADHTVVVIARSDDCTFGVLQSRIHELWALRMGTQLEDRPRYTPTTTVATFPFPQPSDAERARIEVIAAELSQRRIDWLNPPESGADGPEHRTLTNLYNAPPTWLQNLHGELDAAVTAAYGWSDGLSDDEVLSNLLALNLASGEDKEPG
jgi:type II restriction/modification system DNA methylase subunit YeeA